MLAAALGTMKAGKFYVAVNPMHPPAHVRSVLDELDAPLLLCDGGGERIARHGRPACSVEEIVAEWRSEERPGPRFDASRLAYVLYTSGSTGRPRGVAQSRRDMLHNVARHSPLAVGREDCVTLLSADGFVAAVSNPYVALLAGAALAPYSFKDRGIDGMIDWLRAVDVTVLYAFPSFLRQLAAAETSTTHNRLRLAYLGGETVLAADLAAARRLFPSAELSVGLNSSETGLTCLHTIPRGSALPDPVAVGHPVLDVRVAVVSEDGQPLPPGDPGEIEIQSEYVRPRYWSHGAVEENRVSGLAFRTGDRGRIDADSRVYHLGRVDGMVKIRGFRVETAEVEAAIAALDDVAEVAVFVAEEDPSVAQLTACVVADGAGIDPVAVRSAVARRLPPAMIPTRVVIVDALPRTLNGKLDRKGLARLAGESAPGGPSALTAVGGLGRSVARASVSLASAESLIAEIWSTVLGVEEVTAEQDFFALGGTSIKAVSAMARVRRELGVPVPLAVLFEAPTVSSLAAAVIELAQERTLEEDLTGARTVRELVALQAPLRALSLAERRRQYDYADTAFAGEAPAGEPVDAGGCPAEWVLARHTPRQPVVVYMHGGGYCLGSSRSHRHLAAAIGRAAGAAVLSLDYRRAPEFAFPSAVDDALAAIRWLLAETGAPVVLAGDSAGGGLVVACMIALRDAGLSLPAAGVCLSPWVDLTCTSDSHTRLADRDPLLSSAELKRMAAAYLRQADPGHRLASPAFADLAGLPPLLIQVGTEEILLDDAHRLASAARAAGLEVSLEEWPGMIHAWQWYFPVLEQGRRAIAAIGQFIERHAMRAPVARESRQNGHAQMVPASLTQPAGTVSASLAPEACAVPASLAPALASLTSAARVVPASLIQEAHLLIADFTSGRGYLSWVYQLNGRLDAAALARAVDDVVRRHEILRVRFERRGGRMYKVLAPFAPGVLKIVDLGDRTKREGLDAAIEDVHALYRSLSPSDDPRFRATLYTIDSKTSVLAMFVAEALVDSDSGSLLAADIARAYAEHRGSSVPVGLPAVGDASHFDRVLSRPPDREALMRAREHWALQARSAPPLSGWPTTPRKGDARGSIVAFELTPTEWARVTARARALRVTPYVFVLTCLQVALARVANITRFLAHSVVSERGDTPREAIGNFHSLVRIELRFDVDEDFDGAAGHTAMAVAQAIEHRVVPAPLGQPGAPVRLPSGELLPPIRFYMFANHEGPVFAGVRRRRFRLHGVAPAPLSVNCIYAPKGRQDFVFSSTTASRSRVEWLARSFREIVRAAVEESRVDLLTEADRA
jgi:acetyl esterase/lipase/acyl-coenzyme A synthetase/AMP-(fatty) acid ligase